jgi:hypothetical protein
MKAKEAMEKASGFAEWEEAAKAVDRLEGRSNRNLSVPFLNCINWEQV